MCLSTLPAVTPFTPYDKSAFPNLYYLEFVPTTHNPMCIQRAIVPLINLIVSTIFPKSLQIKRQNHHSKQSTVSKSTTNTQTKPTKREIFTHIKPPIRHLLRFIPLRRCGPRQLNLLALLLFLAFGFWLLAYLDAASAVGGLVGERVGFRVGNGFGGGGAHVCEW